MTTKKFILILLLVMAMVVAFGKRIHGMDHKGPGQVIPSLVNRGLAR